VERRHMDVGGRDPALADDRVGETRIGQSSWMTFRRPASRCGERREERVDAMLSRFGSGATRPRVSLKHARARSRGGGPLVGGACGCR